MEAAVLGSGYDDPIDDTRHFGGHSDIGHTLAIGAEGILPDVSFELLSKAVLSLLDCDRSGQPKGASQTGITVFGQLGSTAELATDCCVARSTPQNLRSWR